MSIDVNIAPIKDCADVDSYIEKKIFACGTCARMCTYMLQSITVLQSKHLYQYVRQCIGNF